MNNDENDGDNGEEVTSRWAGPTIDGEEEEGYEPQFTQQTYTMDEPLPEEAYEEFDTALSHYSGLNPRLMHVCLLFAQGERGKDIAKRLNYTQSWLSTLLKREDIQKQIRKYRNQFYERTVKERIKELSSSALSELQRILDDPGAKDDTKLRAATWILEKESGKATQTTQIESNTLLDLFDRIDKLQASGQILDVTPKAGPKQLSVSDNSPDNRPDEAESEQSEDTNHKDWDSVLDEEFSGERNDKW